MKTPHVLLVLAHGRDTSLCHHLVQVACAELDRQGAAWRLHDLLADGFDPVLRLGPGQSHANKVSPEEDPLVARYQEDVVWADAYVVVHPVWWFAPPALLKGWAERVMAGDVALDYSGGFPAGTLGGRSALVVQTFNAPSIAERVLMRRLSGRFWTKVLFPSVGIRDVTALQLFKAGAITEDRLKRFEGRINGALTRLLERGQKHANDRSQLV